jgi:diacylglycerol O-acyltransferase
MAAAATFATGGGLDSSRFKWANCDASCESPPTTPRPLAENPFMSNNVGSVVLRKRMTSIGRFSLKSESDTNLSIPTFFLALSGRKKSDDSTAPGNTTAAVGTSQSTSNIFTVNDFESAWMNRDMPSRHPRFHSTVSKHDDRFFEETHHVKAKSSSSSDNDETNLQIKAELDRHASETMHFSVYREDLRNRIENMLTSPIEVAEKLWEVKISSGEIGSSGAISKVKSEAITTRQRELNEIKALKRQLTKGRLWKDAVGETKSMESVLLFRSHHALADGASIMAALSDLCDEAEEIRSDIEVELKRWKRGKGKKGVLGRLISRLLRLIRFIVWMTLGSATSAMYQVWLQLTTPTNPFDAVKQDAEKKGLAMSGRAISWCDACPLDEAKRITQILSKANGSNITVNDLFVSCISAAVTRQLIEHEEFMAPAAAHSRKYVARNINVCIPVHLRGGVILPHESLGNRIGAFVTRVPGEMTHDARGGGTQSCPSERLMKVHKSLKWAKQSPAPFLSHYVAKFCSDYLPEQWTKNIFKRANCNACVAVSNNRGHKNKIHINGMEVESAHGFLPLPPGIPIGVVVQSYAGVMSLSVTAEKWAVPDPDKFLRWCLDEYSRLFETAAKLETS